MIMIQLPIDREVNIWAMDDDRVTMLYAAAQSGNAAVVQLYLDMELDAIAKINKGETTLHYAAQCPASRDGAAVVRLLISSGAEIMTRDSRQDTALHTAARHDDHEAVGLLIDYGADLNPINKMVLTAFYQTIFWCDASKSARLLLSSGADWEARDNEARTALDCADVDDREEVEQLILEYGISMLEERPVQKTEVTTSS
jgi:ankyrin repeat protein